MGNSPEAAEATMVSNLQDKTGKSLDAWVKIAKASKQTKHGKLVALLKSEHGLTHGYANLVAHRTLKSAASDSAPDDLVASQYSGKKSELKPIYDALIAAVTRFGDVEVSPKKAYVSLRRAKQFAIFQPSTATRLDVGIKLKDVEPVGRLETSGSFNSMVSHRVRVESQKDIDKELVGWLRQAYDAAG